MENYVELIKTRYTGPTYDPRRESLLSFARTPLRNYKESPTVKDYVEITESDLAKMSSGTIPANVRAQAPPDGYNISVVNGRIAGRSSENGAIKALDLMEAARNSDSGLTPEFLSEKGDDRIEHLINSVWQSGIFIDIPKGFTGALKVHDTSDPSLSFALKVIVSCGEDSNVTISTVNTTIGDGDGVQGRNVYIFLGRRAKVQFDYLQDKSQKVTDIVFVKSFLSEYSEFTIYHVNHGGEKVLFSNESIQRGDSSDFKTFGINFSDGQQKMDIRDSSFQIGIATSADVHVKGVVMGKSSTMHRGNIDIEEKSIKSTGYYDSKILLMSRDGFANTKPALLIKNNDTRSKHASAISSVDDEQIFYMRSRGIPKNLAKNLITSGFMGSIVEKSGDDFLTEVVARYSEGLVLDD
ncbi:MAG: SufD family Fe-S cluster assembly protein [Thermoplasmataceae archaeon]